jgi:pimeloyl-ACP methyl ester carboxylesterase
VLVGHSLGGLLVRLYAGSYPREVAGLISVDAVHEILYEAYRALLPPDQLALFTAPGQIDVVASAAVGAGRGWSGRCARCPSSSSPTPPSARSSTRRGIR